MTNDLRLYDEDREITSKIETTDITTEVLEKDENPKREHCLNWYTISKMSIKDHNKN